MTVSAGAALPVIAGGSVTTSTSTDATAQNTDAVNKSIFGKTIPLLFGATKVLCAPIWSAPLQDAGGGDRLITAFYMIGERAPLTNRVKLHQLIIDGTVVYDAKAGTQVAVDYTFYDGSQQQSPPPEIVAAVGAAATPGFRGRMCVMIRNWRISVGKAYPELTALVEQLADDPGTRYVTPWMTAPNVLADPQQHFYNADAGRYFLLTKDDTLASFDVDAGALVGQNKLELSTGFFDAVAYPNGRVRSPATLSPDASELLVGYGVNLDYTQLRAYDVATGLIKSSVGFDDGTNAGAAGSVLYPQLIDVGPDLANNGYWSLHTSTFGKVSWWHRAPGGFAAGTVWNTSDTQLGLTNNGNFVKVLDLTGIVPATNVQLGYVAAEKHIVQLCEVTSGTAADLIAPTDVVFTYGSLSGLQVGSFWYANNAGIVNKHPQGYDVQKTVSCRAVTSCVKVFDLNAHPQPSAFNEYIMGLWFSADGGRCVVITHCDFAGGTSNIRLISCVTVLGGKTVAKFNNDAGVLTNGYGGLPSPMTDQGGANFGATSQFAITSDVLVAGGLIDSNTLRQLNGGQSYIVYGAAGSQYDFVLLDLNTGSVLNLEKGVYVNTLTNATYNGIIEGLHSGAFYDQDAGVFYYYKSVPDYPGEIYFDTGGAASHANLPLATYLRSLGVLAGFDPGDIATNAPLDTVKIVGSIINTQVDFLTLVAQVCQLFAVDVVETEGKLKFNGPVRGDGFETVRTLTADDLAPPDQFSQDDGSLILKERADANSLPTILDVAYLDSDNDFQVGTQRAKRTQYPYRTSAGQAVPILSVPIAITSVTALYWANFALFEAWNGALTITGLTTFEQLDLEPGDYVELDAGVDGRYVVKLTNVSLNADWSVSLTAVTVGVEAAAADQVNTANGTTVGEQPASVPYHVALIENFSPLQDHGDTPLVTILSDAPADVYVFDTPTTYALAQVDGGAVFGVILNSHPAQSNWEAADDTTPIIVQTTSIVGSMSLSVTDADFLAGAAIAVIGAPGRYELIYYRDVAPNADGTFTISHILRGRRGSDSVMGLQQPGDVFIAIPASTALAQARFTATGLPYQLPVKHQARGGATKLKSTTLDVSGGSIRPWAPADVRAARSGADVVLTWQRRDRQEVDLLDTGDDSAAVPLSEATEAYDIEILANDGTVKRTANVTVPTFTYTALMASFDGIDTSTYITVNVYQISAVVGRGFVRKVTCPII